MNTWRRKTSRRPSLVVRVLHGWRSFRQPDTHSQPVPNFYVPLVDDLTRLFLKMVVFLDAVEPVETGCQRDGTVLFV